jgi:hypothetical protein
MRRGPAANGHQSQEDEGQQRSADDAWDGEVAISPQLARRFQSVSHDRDARSLHERAGIVDAGAGTFPRLLTEGRRQRPRKVTSKRDVYRFA